MEEKKEKTRKPYNWRGKGWQLDEYMFTAMEQNEPKKLFLFCLERMTVEELLKALLLYKCGLKESVFKWGWKYTLRCSAMKKMIGSEYMVLSKEYDKNYQHCREYKLADNWKW